MRRVLSVLAFLLVTVTFQSFSQNTIPSSDSTGTVVTPNPDTSKVGKPTLLLNENGLKTVIPPSPTSQEYDKYINYNVSLYNGIPEISIPLYSIQVGSTSVPISLKYHASGIKHGQLSGEVGVGWVLEPGYRVSRTINGRPDELYEKPVINLSGLPTNNQSRDEYLTKFIWYGETDIPHATEIFDGEYDLFTYSVPSGSGTFIIEDRATQKVRQLSHSNHSIEYTPGVTYSLDKFTLKDGNGITYTTGPIENNANSGYLPIAPSSWVVQELMDPFGNYATFDYSLDTEIASVTPMTLLARSGGSGIFSYECFQHGFASGSSTELPTYQVQRVSEIVTKEQKVTFFRSYSLLDSIVVKNSKNERVRKIAFYYSKNNIHAFLDSVTISGRDIVNSPTYKFGYINKAASDITQFLPDYWGYYKSRTPIGYPFPQFGPYSVCITEGIWASYLGDHGLTQNDRNPLENDATIFTLNRVTYPTGGITHYEYESNKYTGMRDDTWVLGDKYAGIRIKKISSEDLVDNSTLVKEYRYGTNEGGLGEVNVDMANHRLFARERPSFNCTTVAGQVVMAQEILFSTSINEEFQGGHIGAPVTYSKVTEYSRNNSTSTSPLNGKVEYAFDRTYPFSWGNYSVNNEYSANMGILRGTGGECGPIPEHTSDVSFPNYYLTEYRSWDTPVLKTKLVYKYEDSNYTLLRKESNTYTVEGLEFLFGLKVRRFFGTSSRAYTTALDYYDCGINSLFDYATYQIAFANKVLKENTITTYALNDSIRQRTAYYYNSDFQVSKTEELNSDGSLTTTKFKYPIDFGSITATDNISLGIKKLQDTHVLNPGIEIIKERSSSVNTLMNAYFHAYKTDRPLQDRIMIAESDIPVVNFTSSSNTSGAVNYDNRYKSRIQFNAYDPQGNLLEQQKTNDVKEVYLWGYRSMYPVAKVTGSDLSTVQGFVSQSVLDNPATSDVAMRAELDNIRTGLSASKALVMTYTYNPLVGMTSETDVNGKTIVYEYDNLGRLKTSRNLSGTARASYCYNYAGQIKDCAALAPTGSIAASALSLLAEVESGGPLPVSLLRFEAKRKEHTAVLTWSTTSELNSDRFEIERSKDGKVWIKLGAVNAAGNSNDQQDYFFTDTKPENKENLYRFKILDRAAGMPERDRKDGTFSYSRIRSVYFDKDNRAILYPNPVTVGEKLKLLTDDLTTIKNIKIFDVKGRAVHQSMAAREINVSHLTPGLYVVQVTYSDGSVSNYKVVKQ